MLPLPPCALIGMVHLPALPGSANSILDMTEILERAAADAVTLRQAGFHAAMVENFGDRPFRAEAVDPVTIASMAIVARHVREACGMIVGVNVLRNDAGGALAVAVAAGAKFIRVNVHTGVMATDQGLLTGGAAQTLRMRRSLGAVAAGIAILADVHVKHATPVHPLSIADAAKETAYRGLADGLIVSGVATGHAIDPADLEAVCAAVPDRRVFIGSGATAENIGSQLSRVGGVIVGSSLKRDGDPAAPIDAGLAKRFVEAARSAGAQVPR